MVERILLHCFFVFYIPAFAAAQTRNLSDGPYISYNKSMVIVRSINDYSKVIVDSFPVSEISSHPVQVQFTSHPKWNFEVSLKKQIEIPPSEYEASDSILALSDIEGEFESLRLLLIGNHVMDSASRWTFGNNQLVICGDLFDRGKDVAALLWLLYKLEGEAKAASGYVHIILGNHDIMNLSGDFRYVAPKYVENPIRMGIETRDLYTADTELGRWLLSKNLIEKIGDNLCLHAGISREILNKKMGLAEINNSCRPFYNKAKYPEDVKIRNLIPFFDNNGLFWYRGYFENPRASQSTIDKTCSFYHCSRIIVGHTIAKSNIASYYQNKVFGIDVDEHAGDTEAILILRDKIYSTDGTGTLDPVPEGPSNPVIL